MRAQRFSVVAAIFLAWATLASAEEVIYFTNGTYMKIVAHEIKGEMIKVHLDGSATMAFPARMVDKIEGASGIVFGAPANPVYPNQIVPGSPNPEPYAVNSGAVVGVRSPEAEAQYPNKLQKTAEPAARAEFDPAGMDDTILGARLPGPSGTMRMGNRYVVGQDGTMSTKGRFVPQKFGMKGGAGTVEVEKPASDPANPPPNQ